MQMNKHWWVGCVSITLSITAIVIAGIATFQIYPVNGVVLFVLAGVFALMCFLDLRHGDDRPPV